MEKARLLKTLGWLPKVGDRVLMDTDDDALLKLDHPEGRREVYVVTTRTLSGDWICEKANATRRIERFEDQEVVPCILRATTPDETP